MNKKPQILVLTINSASSIPPLHHLLGRLSDRYAINVIECSITGYPSLPNPINIRPIAEFKDRHAFNHQTKATKIKKYSTVMLKGLLSKIHEREVTLYIIDWQLLLLLMPLSGLLKRRGWKIVYHQFELNESLPDSFKGRMATPLDLAIFPEQNRRDYFFKLYNASLIKEDVIIPNTCPVPQKASEVPELPINDRRVIGHVGSIGPKHFLHTLAEMIETLPEDKFYFLIIGGNSPEVEEVLSPLSQKKTSVVLGIYPTKN